MAHARGVARRGGAAALNAHMSGDGPKRDVIVIRASAGGVPVLLDLCAGLPADLPAIVGVVLHRSPWYRVDLAALYGAHPGAGSRRGRAAGTGDGLFCAPGSSSLVRGVEGRLVPRAESSFFTALGGRALRVGGGDVRKTGRGPAPHRRRIRRGAWFGADHTGGRRDLRAAPDGGGASDDALVRHPGRQPDGIVSLKALPELLTALAAGRPAPVDRGDAHPQAASSRAG